MNIAGMMAKYLATSLAIENVVKAPRVMSSCLPIATISISFVNSVLFPQVPDYHLDFQLRSSRHPDATPPAHFVGGRPGWLIWPVGFLTGTNSRVELWYRLGAPSVSSVTVNLAASLAKSGRSVGVPCTRRHEMSIDARAPRGRL